MDSSALDPWREVRFVDETASTNADLAAAADAGEPAGLVLVAERQTAGRGRLDRSWVAPPGSGLTFSVLLRPAVPMVCWGWLPLLTGLAVAEAVREVAGVPAQVKWPNDVLVGERKLAGVLAEVRPGASTASMASTAIVVGIGLNLTLELADLPVPTATSLLIEGATTADRTVLLDAILDVLGARYRSWVESGGDADACGVRAAYTARCATVGRSVQVELPTGGGGTRVLKGEAVGIDSDGRLRVNDLADGQSHEIAAGDVVHVR